MRTLSVDSLRNEAKTILNEVEDKGELVYIEDGQKSAVLMGFDQYRAFMARLEDLEDALDLKEAIATSKRVRPYEEYLKARNKGNRF